MTSLLSHQSLSACLLPQILRVLFPPSFRDVFATFLLSEHLGHSTIFGLAFDTVKSGIADCNDLSFQILFTLDEDSYNRT